MPARLEVSGVSEGYLPRPPPQNRGPANLQFGAPGRPTATPASLRIVGGRNLRLRAAARLLEEVVPFSHLSAASADRKTPRDF